MYVFRRLGLPSPSMVVAVAALIVALGGTSYAAATLAANSVGARQLKKSAVERSKIKKSAVDASKVLDGSLTGADIKESSLAKVPAAALADNATHATSTAALDKVSYKATVGSAGTASVATAATATCDAGQHVLGGGVKLDDPINQLVDDSYPDAGNTAWTAHVDNPRIDTAVGFTVWAICTSTTTTG